MEDLKKVFAGKLLGIKAIKLQPNDHLTQIFRRQIALVLSLRTNGADHQHIMCGPPAQQQTVLNNIVRTHLYKKLKN